MNHIPLERFRKIAERSVVDLSDPRILLESKELAHIKDCQECVNRFAESVREAIKRQEKRPDSAG